MSPSVTSCKRIVAGGASDHDINFWEMMYGSWKFYLSKDARNQSNIKCFLPAINQLMSAWLFLKNHWQKRMLHKHFSLNHQKQFYFKETLVLPIIWSQSKQHHQLGAIFTLRLLSHCRAWQTKSLLAILYSQQIAGQETPSTKWNFIFQLDWTLK